MGRFLPKFKHSFLPEKKYFYSSLKDGKRDRSNGHSSDEQYQHLQNVWNVFKFNFFEDFHNHYLNKDVKDDWSNVRKNK